MTLGTGTQLKIFIKEVPAGSIQDNFRTLQNYVESVNQFMVTESQFVGFQHFDITFTAAAANFKIDHDIGEIPLDLVQTYLTGSATVTWNYANFSKDTIDVTVSAACRVRFYVGTHKAGTPL